VVVVVERRVAGPVALARVSPGSSSPKGPQSPRSSDQIGWIGVPFKASRLHAYVYWTAPRFDPNALAPVFGAAKRRIVERLAGSAGSSQKTPVFSVGIAEVALFS